MIDLPGYDRWKTRVPNDPPVVRQCDYCGDDLYDGQEALLLITGDIICEECFYDYARKELQPTTVILSRWEQW